MEFFSPDTRNKFKIALGWMNKWACSRTYGLGTKLPWDEQYLIESLSDSTIYNAYYSVAYLLQGGVIDGSKTGPSGIKPEQLTHAVWDYIFLNGQYPADCGIAEDVLAKLRKEFKFWYPVDLRCSGKDLITNHLTFFMYCHTAVFPQEHWPKGIRANGFMLLNGAKMSKSEGNFMTLVESVEKYSSDGTRFALADAGDSLDDANFLAATADGAILRLYAQIKWIEEILAAKDLRENEEFADRAFDAEMNKLIRQTEVHYERTNFREALQSGFYAMQSARDTYKLLAAERGLNRKSILKFIENQVIIMAPITPHFSEHVWKLLGKTGSVRTAAWPKVPEETPEEIVIIQQKDYLFTIAHTFRIRKDAHMKPKKSKDNKAAAVPAPTKAILYVASAYPEWKQKVLTFVKPMFEAGAFDSLADEKEEKAKEKENSKKIMDFAASDAEIKKHTKKLMPFVAQTKDSYKLQGKSVLDLKLSFDEKEYLSNNVGFLKRSLEIPDVQVADADEDMLAKERCSPGQPLIIFE